MTLYSYPDILTIDDAMDILKIGRNQCYELLRKGILKGFKIGCKAWKIPKESLEEFINTNGYNDSM